MCYHLYRNRHHPPNKPHSAKPGPIKRQYHPPQQTEKKQDFDEESGLGFRIPFSSSINNVTSLIGAVVSLLEVIIILLIALAGSIGIAAFLLALLIGGNKAAEIFLHLLEQKVS